MDVDKVLAHKFEPSTVEITDKDVMLYALAIGEATVLLIIALPYL